MRRSKLAYTRPNPVRRGYRQSSTRHLGTRCGTFRLPVSAEKTSRRTGSPSPLSAGTTMVEHNAGGMRHNIASVQGDIGPTWTRQYFPNPATGFCPPSPFRLGGAPGAGCAVEVGPSLPNCRRRPVLHPPVPSFCWPRTLRFANGPAFHHAYIRPDDSASLLRRLHTSGPGTVHCLPRSRFRGAIPFRRPAASPAAGLPSWRLPYPRHCPEVPIAFTHVQVSATTAPVCRPCVWRCTMTTVPLVCGISSLLPLASCGTCSGNPLAPCHPAAQDVCLALREQCDAGVPLLPASSDEHLLHPQRQRRGIRPAFCSPRHRALPSF
jgi:hypothetical protein